MALLRHHLFLSFTILIISFVACYTTLQEDPLSTTVYIDHSTSIHDGGTFNNLIIKQTTDDILSLNKFGGTSRSLKRVNVNDYGATGNGTDDTEAFEKAWKVVCSYSGEAVLVVPEENNYLLKPIRFSGPCKSNIQVQISGTLEASDDPSDYSEDRRHWLKFDSIKKLFVSGGGTINGKGNIWWQNSCKRNKKLPCKDAPTALTFYNCEDLVVENLTIENGQQIQVSFQDSMNVKVSGDDCISIVHGSRNVEAIDITCGPGHGISIGSLGARKSEDFVSGVIVNRAKLSGTKNGGGSGSASNITFQNIEMDNVTNPIIIDQNYCDKKKNKKCKKQQKSAVQIKNVLYQNITGTSASDVAVKFDCSENFPCEEIVLQNIDIQCEEGDDDAKASCNNVELSYLGHVSPRCYSKRESYLCITSALKDAWYM
ncbi:Pectin lyase fold/virulence factor [Sesbania bispinosa]|nr:Pectin lyase fold/virulence factor [Sesbania bispinosa]